MYEIPQILIQPSKSQRNRVQMLPSNIMATMETVPDFTNKLLN